MRSEAIKLAGYLFLSLPTGAAYGMLSSSRLHPDAWPYMIFSKFLKVSRTDCPEDFVERSAADYAKLVGRGLSNADLLEKYGDRFGHLPDDQLVHLRRAYDRWQRWRQTKNELENTRARNRSVELPRDAVFATHTVDELNAMYRAARTLPRDSYSNDNAWAEALRSTLNLWRACVGIARKQSSVRCTVKHPEAAAKHYEAYANSSHVLTNMPAHRWLAMRRGQREGVLELHYEHPISAMEEQVALVRKQFGDRLESRENHSILEELVLNDLDAALSNATDERAAEQAIDTACGSLRGLLSIAGIPGDRIGSVYLSNAAGPIAFVVVNRDGALAQERLLRPKPGSNPEIWWKTNGLSKGLELLREFGVETAVVPTSASSSSLLNACCDALRESEIEVIHMRTAALAEARQPLTTPPNNFDAPVASAVVLARRAFDPLTAWSSVDPLSIGVAEYQHDLNDLALRSALSEVIAIAKWRRKSSGKVNSTRTTATHIGGRSALANPIVKSLNDLRAGMPVKGVVTNISHFGAFVNFGIPQEGLVHISELSDSFVSDPNEVVRIGQQVNARVLSVDSSRGRIALSMKTGSAVQGKRPKNRDNQPRPGQKTQALKNLESLFKK